jgi:Flp pilus assembly protein TadG
MALILPVFLTLLLFLFDFGRVVYAQNTITNDAREAVRTAVVNADYSLAKYGDIRASARKMSPLVSWSDANITGAPGVTCATVTDSPSATCFYLDIAPGGGKPSAGSRVEVNIAVSVNLITPLISSILGGSISVTAKSVGFVQCSAC